jgi:hypothetical protein
MAFSCGRCQPTHAMEIATPPRPRGDDPRWSLRLLTKRQIAPPGLSIGERAALPELARVLGTGIDLVRPRTD